MNLINYFLHRKKYLYCLIRFINSFSLTDLNYNVSPKKKLFKFFYEEKTFILFK